MKHVASIFSMPNGLRPRVLVSVSVAICILLPLAFLAGCGSDEDSVNFPIPPTTSVKHWLFGIGGTDASNIYACGVNGAMFRFDGASWTLTDMGVGSSIVSIENVDGTLYAVGHSGKIWSNSGTTWSSMTSGTNQNLFGLGEFQDETYATGFDGTLLKLSGSSWSGVGGTLVIRDANFTSTDTLRMDRDIISLVTIGDNFIGGAYLDPLLEGEVFGTNGTKGMILSKDIPQEEETTVFNFWLRPLSGAELIDDEWIVSSISDSDVPERNFLATSEGYLFRLRADGNWGKDNLQVTHDRNQGVSDMYLSPDDRLYMVTDDGLVVVREDDGTTTVLLDQNTALTGIWGTDSSNLYIVGYMEDELYHAIHHAGTDTLEITKIPLVFPGDSAKSAWDGINRDKFNRPVAQ